MSEAEAADKPQKTLEIRLELLHKAGDTYVQNTSFEITDQVLCEEINDLLGKAITAAHIAMVPTKDGKPVFDGHKFELTGEQAEAEEKTA